MIDNKTSRLQLPLPNVENYLEDDVARLSSALTTLDGAVATVGEDGKLVQDQVPDYVPRLDAEGKLPVEQGGTGSSTVDDARIKLQVNRLMQAGSETGVQTPDGSRYFTVSNGGTWGVWAPVEGAWNPLGVGQGGTGAVTLSDARVNLQVNRLGQEGTYTEINSANGTKRIVVNDSGDWGGWDGAANNWRPLGVSQGGTGVTDIGSLRRAMLVQGVINNDQTGPESYNSYRSPNSEYTFRVLNNGKAFVAHNPGGEVMPFGVEYGGTGATTVDSAKANLKVDRFIQGSVDTRISTPDGEYNFFITDADWGLFNVSSMERIALPVISGGTGAVTETGACKSLGAMHYKYPAQTSFGQRYMETGIGYYSSDLSPSPGGNGAPYNYSEILTVSEFGDGANYSQIAFSILTEQAPRYRQRFDTNPRLTNWRDFLIRDLNTTVDSNGFLKIASPIVKIKGDGSAELNSESEGCTVTRKDVGVYVITGCLGLNSDAAWGGTDGGFEIPLDRNKQPRIWLDYQVNDDGSILVKTYHRTHPDAPMFARNELEGYSNGDPIDIPPDTFISVRVQMPD